MSTSRPPIELFERAEATATPAATLTLTFEHRQRSRLRVRLDDGTEAALLLPRGEVLRGGDRLCSRCGRTVEVRAADERVSHVASADPCALARAAYHLGNRHVAVEVGDGWLRYLHDHVLDAMIRALGLAVTAVDAPFEPESGAYAGHAHGPSHGHSHAHGPGSHSHAHGHDPRSHGHGHDTRPAARSHDADAHAGDDGALGDGRVEDAPDARASRR